MRYFQGPIFERASLRKRSRLSGLRLLRSQLPQRKYENSYDVLSCRKSNFERRSGFNGIGKPIYENSLNLAKTCL